MTHEPENTISYKLGSIETKLDTMLEYQKIQNGRLGKHDEFLAGLKQYQDTQKGEIKVWAIMASLIGTIIGIAVAFLKK